MVSLFAETNSKPWGITHDTARTRLTKVFTEAKLPTLWVRTTSLLARRAIQPKLDLQQHRLTEQTPNAERAEHDWHDRTRHKMIDEREIPHDADRSSQHATHSIGRELILKETCFKANQEAQFAFKILMIHWVLQFTLRIAFRCVLHRCENQDIHC